MLQAKIYTHDRNNTSSDYIFYAVICRRLNDKRLKTTQRMAFFQRLKTKSLKKINDTILKRCHKL